MWRKWSFSPNCWKPLSVQASFQCGVCNKSPISLLQSYQPQNGKLALTKGSGTTIKMICLPSSPHVASINHCVVFWKKPVAVFIDQPSSQGSWPLIRRPRVSLGRAFGSFSPSENLRSSWRDSGRQDGRRNRSRRKTLFLSSRRLTAMPSQAEEPKSQVPPFRFYTLPYTQSEPCFGPILRIRHRGSLVFGEEQCTVSLPIKYS